MNWSTIKLGKYKGQTLPQAMFSDPDWFYWGIEKKIFKWNLAEEARSIYRKSRSIKIPNSSTIPLQAEYCTYEGKFVGLEIVPASQPIHRGGCHCFRHDVIDMKIVRNMCPYHKIGYRLLISNIKWIIFGDNNFRMTKKRCEEFFENDSNFIF